ncbi:M28 family peptidase [candidate division KSB1 bacterium]
MRLKRFFMISLLLVLVLSVNSAFAQTFPYSQDDPVLKRIIELGKTDNQVMKWLDIACNRFGGRYTGTDAYNNAAEWAVYQLKQFGLEAKLEEVGEVPVGFNRGPWFGKMVKPEEKALYFGTPSYTAGTKGVQRGHVVIAPEDSAEILTMQDKFKNAWVLIPGNSNGFARDGRRETRKSFLVQTLEKSGALGTIQRSAVPMRILDGNVSSWDELPVLPDIKLQDTQYDEIKEIVKEGKEVELEFDIRNWFKMGPVKYHNVIAWIPGTTYPYEYVVLGGHFDSFDGSTGAVDDGSGFTPVMEAARLIVEAGGRPKRTIIVQLYAAEEMGLVGSHSWVDRHANTIPRISTMLGRDGSPSAITGVTVPQSWATDFEKISKPLINLNPKWPFQLNINPYPGARPTRASGTDAVVFAVAGVPLLRMNTQTDYQYRRAWHTLFDTYNELVPYQEHQEHSALVMAVLSYGIANLDHQLSREDVYLHDGLYADINTDKGRVMVKLDYFNAPETVSSFVKLFEDPNARPGRRRFRGRRRGPAIGAFTKIDSKRAAHGTMTAEQYTARAVPELKKEKNPNLTHKKAGILGMIDPVTFYLTSRDKSNYDDKYTPIGTVIAGFDIIKTIVKGDSLRGVSIIRVGQKAAEFK